MRAVIVGDEVLTGRIRDANLWLLARLARGFEINKGVVVRDDEAEIAEAVEEAFEEDGQVVVCGGLGPTPDDRTRQALAIALSMRLEFNERVWEMVQERVKALNYPESPLLRNYALVPEGFVPIPNPVGIAPGLLWRQGERFVLALPGVPRELEAVFREAWKHIADLAGGGVWGALATAGAPEVLLAERLEGIESVAFYPRGVEVVVRFWASDPESLARKKELIKEKIAQWVYWEGDEPLEKALGEELRARGLTVATAESCTGGLCSHLITQIPGSSEYHKGGVVAYLEEVKEKVLGVKRETLEKYTVYSAQVAEEMAQGVAKLLGSDLALSVTCVAGPTGERVGLTYIGVWFKGKVKSYQLQLGGNRHQVKEAAAKHMLRLGLLAVRRGEPA